MNIVTADPRLIKSSIYTLTVLCSLLSAHISFALAVPSVITTLAGSADATSVTLTWTAPASNGASITDYTIQYRLNGDNAWTTFTDGVSTTASATVTGLITDTTYDFSVMAVNSQGTASISNIIPVKAGYVFITTPIKGVSGAPLVATRAITDDYTAPFYIPYIQTSTTLSVTATVASAGLPVSGGVKFVLNKGLTGEQTVYDMSSPFTVSFTSLTKAEYTIDVYIVDSSQVVQSGEANHDQATNIGIGDIILGVGDSITEGYYDTDLGATPIANWTTAPVGTVSTDNRQFPQHGAFSGRWKEGFLTKLQNMLVSYYGYPVFIMNDGKAGITSAGYVSMMSGAGYRTRVAALAPNKALVNLGVNDAYNNLSASSLQTNLQTIINTELKTRYGLSAANIWLAYPNYSIDSAFHNLLEPYQPYYTSVISNTGVSAGPDFWTFFKNHYNDGYHYIDLMATSQDVHPNTAGFTQMAYLYGLNMLAPRNLTASESVGSNGTVTFSWSNLSSIEPSVASYRLSYGTTSGVYTNTTDFTGATSGTLTASNFTHGTTYYAVLKASDNDVYSPNYSPNSSEISFVFRGTPLAPTVTGVSGTEKVTVSWDTPDTGGSAITDYVIEYKLSSSNTWLTYSDGVSTSTSVTVTELTGGARYDFRVTAVNSNGTGVVSDTVSVSAGSKPVMGSMPIRLMQNAINMPTVIPLVPNHKSVCINTPIKRPVQYGVLNNKTDILVIKKFLNEIESEKLNTQSTFYDTATRAAVKRFQLKYAKDILTPLGIKKPTGVVYTATWKQMKFLSCK